MTSIAIIPAKAHSERLTNKNLQLLRGKPLFLHSVQYAINEGITPVVSTDSRKIANICKRLGVQCLKEKVEERDIAICVGKVLEAVPCDLYALLQPTSPLRVPGLLRSFFTCIKSNWSTSVYTYKQIKVIGHLDGDFQYNYRDQDATRNLYWFDGNIVAGARQFFEKHHALFHHSSLPVKNEFPCSMQVDTKEDLLAIRAISKLANFKKYLVF